MAFPASEPSLARLLVRRYLRRIAKCFSSEPDTPDGPDGSEVGDHTWRTCEHLISAQSVILIGASANSLERKYRDRTLNFLNFHTPIFRNVVFFGFLDFHAAPFLKVLWMHHVFIYIFFRFYGLCVNIWCRSAAPSPAAPRRKFW